MSDNDGGDFKGLAIDAVLEQLREKLDGSRKKGEKLRIDQSESDTAYKNLQSILREYHSLPAAKQPTRQAAFDCVWTALRPSLDAGGVALNYTSVADPYNIVNLAWSGGEELESKNKRFKMKFNEEFMRGHLTFQGPEYDPMPALDIEQDSASSYFQTDVIESDEIEHMDDYLQLMKPFGIEDWMATMVSCTEDYHLVLLPFFYFRPGKRERQRIRSLMENVSGLLAEIFDWVGLSGSSSISAMLTARQQGTGTILLDPVTMTATYDHAAIAMVRELLPHAPTVESVIWRIKREIQDFTLIQGYRDLSELSVFNGRLEVHAKNDHVQDRGIIHLVLGTSWEPDERQLERARTKWGMSVCKPKKHQGELGELIHYKDNRLKHHLHRHLVEKGNAVALGTVSEPALLIAEPVTRQTLKPALEYARRSPAQAVTPFQRDFYAHVEDLNDPTYRLILHDDKQIFAILRKVEGRRPIDRLRKIM
jgi:hypothetical protein